MQINSSNLTKNDDHMVSSYTYTHNEVEVVDNSLKITPV